MVKCSFSHMECSVARALDNVGEWWTLLIIRDLMIFRGTRRFEELRDGLGIARNILTERLRGLLESGIVIKVPVAEGARRREYQLTEKGWDLMPIMLALMQWGDKWRPDQGNADVAFVNKRNGQPIASIVVTAADGRPLRQQDMQVQPLKPDVRDYLEDAEVDFYRAGE
jgi:DNA-binding HxlR family transcriptional regulator